jgi:hypothetical protein
MFNAWKCVRDSPSNEQSSSAEAANPKKDVLERYSKHAARKANFVIRKIIARSKRRL